MKYFITVFFVFIFLISGLLIGSSLSARTVSGEIGNTPKKQYMTDSRGTCYTLIKNTRNGKMIKRIVAKKYCKKTNTAK